MHWQFRWTFWGSLYEDLYSSSFQDVYRLNRWQSIVALFMLLEIFWCYEKLCFLINGNFYFKVCFWVGVAEFHKALCTLLTSGLCILEIFCHTTFSCDPHHLFAPNTRRQLMWSYLYNGRMTDWHCWYI